MTSRPGRECESTMVVGANVESGVIPAQPEMPEDHVATKVVVTRSEGPICASRVLYNRCCAHDFPELGR